MNATEVGTYMLLLMFHWNHGQLPDEKDMPQVARVNAKTWRCMSAKILGRVQQDAAALDAQKAKVRETSKKRTAAAQARWE